jgi:hypothetical protein
MAYVQSRIQIVGLNEAVAGLKAMGAEKELKDLNFRVGGLVVKEAKQLVPVRSGNLQNSIRASKTARSVVVIAGRDPFIPYANPINWGWFYDREYFIQKNIMPTQYMNKAAAKVRGLIGQFYMEDLVKIYEKYAGKDYDGAVIINRDLGDVTERIK